MIIRVEFVVYLWAKRNWLAVVHHLSWLSASVTRNLCHLIAFVFEIYPKI